MAYDAPRADRHVVISEDATSQPDEADERAASQVQHPWQAPPFEPANPRASPTSLGEEKGKVERLIIKLFLVAAALLFCCWVAGVLNRGPARPWQSGDPNARSGSALQPGAVFDSNSAPWTAAQNDRASPAAQQSDQNDRANPALKPSSQKREPAFTPPSRQPRMAARDQFCRFVPLRHRNYWNCRNF
jgi:hypothetical protein